MIVWPNDVNYWFWRPCHLRSSFHISNVLHSSFCGLFLPWWWRWSNHWTGASFGNWLPWLFFRIIYLLIKGWLLNMGFTQWHEDELEGDKRSSFWRIIIEHKFWDNFSVVYSIIWSYCEYESRQAIGRSYLVALVGPSLFGQRKTQQYIHIYIAAHSSTTTESYISHRQASYCQTIWILWQCLFYLVFTRFEHIGQEACNLNPHSSSCILSL